MRHGDDNNHNLQMWNERQRSDNNKSRQIRQRNDLHNLIRLL